MNEHPQKTQQLRHAMELMSTLPFITSRDENKYSAQNLGLQSFALQTSDLHALKSIYMSHLDETGVHVYSSQDEHHVYIYESLAFYEDMTFDDILYAHVIELVTQEYEATRKCLIDILGNPSYQNDQYSEYTIANRHIDSEYWQRRDVPLELQLIHHLGEFKLTYWLQNELIIYLAVGHVDKEESVALMLGVRPDNSLD